MATWMCVLLGVLAALLDWSGIGSTSLRDRFAAVLYLGAALGWSDTLGISRWELTTLSAMTHDWQIIWRMASVVPVIFWIFAMAPPLAQLGRAGEMSFSRRAGVAGRAGAHQVGPRNDRINTWLLGWTVGVAAAIPLALPSAYGAIVTAIDHTVSTTTLTIGRAVAGFFGWS